MRGHKEGDGALPLSGRTQCDDVLAGAGAEIGILIDYLREQACRVEILLASIQSQIFSKAILETS